MSCIYNRDFQSYRCQMFDEESDDNGDFKTAPVGWSKKGSVLLRMMNAQKILANTMNLIVMMKRKNNVRY